MKIKWTLLLTIITAVTLNAAESPILGEWISVERTKGGLGSARNFAADGVVQATFGAFVDFQYKLDGNKLTLTLVMPGGAPDIVQQVEIKDATMTIAMGTQEKQELTRIAGTPQSGIIGKWTGNHYAGGKQILQFTPSNNCYFSLPMKSTKGTYQINGDKLIEVFGGQNKTEWIWSIDNDVLTLKQAEGKTQKYMRMK